MGRIRGRMGKLRAEWEKSKVEWENQTLSGTFKALLNTTDSQKPRIRFLIVTYGALTYYFIDWSSSATVCSTS